MLDQLLANPRALVEDLPGAQEWAAKFFGTAVTGAVQLELVTPFLDQIANFYDAGNAHACESISWDPYEDGYDDGPGDIADDWRTDDTISTGQYRGTVVTGAFDKLSAIMGALLDDSERDENLYDAFVKLAEEDWVPPRPAAERDKTISQEVRYYWKKLSPEAQRALHAELTPKAG